VSCSALGLPSLRCDVRAGALGVFDRAGVPKSRSIRALARVISVREPALKCCLLMGATCAGLDWPSVGLSRCGQRHIGRTRPYIGVRSNCCGDFSHFCFHIYIYIYICEKNIFIFRALNRTKVLSILTFSEFFVLVHCPNIYLRLFCSRQHFNIFFLSNNFHRDVCMRTD